jgi:hypothetical protein
MKTDQEGVCFCLETTVPRANVMRLFHSHSVFHGTPKAVYVYCSNVDLTTWIKTLCDRYEATYILKSPPPASATKCIEIEPDVGFLYILFETSPPPLWINKMIIAGNRLQKSRGLRITVTLAGKRYTHSATTAVSKLDKYIRSGRKAAE